jgi:hypothetical protein
MKCDKNLSSQKKLFHFNGMFLGWPSIKSIY